MNTLLNFLSFLYHTVTFYLLKLFVTVPDVKVNRKGVIVVIGTNFNAFEGFLPNKDMSYIYCCSDAKLASQKTNYPCIPLDLLSQSSIDACCKLVQQKLHQKVLVGILVISQQGTVSPLETIDREALLMDYEVNTLGPLVFLQKMIPNLQDSQGRIVILQPISSWMSSPLLGSMASSKMALESLVDTLRVELYKFSISISLIEVGALATPLFFSHYEEVKSLERTLSSTHYHRYEELIQSVSRVLLDTSPSDVLYAQKAIENAFFSSRPLTRYFVGWDARMTWWMKSYLPDRWSDALFSMTLSDTTE